jgi:hypothetical protein
MPGATAASSAAVRQDLAAMPEVLGKPRNLSFTSSHSARLQTTQPWHRGVLFPFGIWNLVLVWNLGFGIWNFVVCRSIF